MLKESNTNNNFSVGDFVIIPSMNQTGRIVSFENGHWKVQIDGGPVIIKESNEIQKRQALFG